MPDRPGQGAQTLRASLQTGLAQLALQVSEPDTNRLLEYIQLLEKWNRTHNLTAVTDPAEMVVKHLLDSLAVLPHLPRGRMLDAGTGAGLPGLPLAVLCPAREFVLVDASQKRVAFLHEVKRKLALNNITAIHARLEQLQDPLCEIIISRAFSSLDKMVETTRHLLAADGCWLAMKGRYPGAEIAELPEDIAVLSSVELPVPGLLAERHLIIMKQKPAKRF